MKFKNKHILVYGLGDSGRASVKLLKNLHAYVSFYDDNVKYFEYIGFERNPQQKWDLVVVSPGIKCLGNPLLEWFREANVPVISELDLAFLNCKGKIIAITGTNGKTTVSMLTYKILKNAKKEVFLCGNIGLPFSAICQETTKNSIVVCEVSNFQLETSKFFRADVCAILNIKPDHLDRHGSFEEYKRVKCKIAQNMRKNDVLVLNYDDEETKNLNIHKKIRYFSKNNLRKDVYVWKNQIYSKRKRIISLSDIPLAGEKNCENVLASVALTENFKIDSGTYLNSIKNFVPADHRMQNLGKLGGVTYVDDSKATNVASTVACLQAYKNEDIFLLMGGQGKEIDYDEIFKNNFKLKCVACFGAERENIAKSAKKASYKTEVFEHFEDAVKYCISKAKENDFCILSPGCSSFDEFKNYAERGETFKNIILEQIKK